MCDKEGQGLKEENNRNPLVIRCLENLVRRSVFVEGCDARMCIFISSGFSFFPVNGIDNRSGKNKSAFDPAKLLNNSLFDSGISCYIFDAGNWFPKELSDTNQGSQDEEESGCQSIMHSKDFVVDGDIFDFDDVLDPGDQVVLKSSGIHGALMLLLTYSREDGVSQKI